MFIGFYGVDDYSFDRSAWHVDGCLCCFWVSVGSPSAGFRSGVIMPGPMRPLSAIIGGVGEVLEGTGESEGFCVVGRARGRAQVARPGFRSDRRRLEGLRPVGWCLGGGRAGPAGSGRSRGCRRTNHKGWGRVEVLHGGGEVLENLALGEVSTGRWFGKFGGSACAEGLGELALGRGTATVDDRGPCFLLGGQCLGPSRSLPGTRVCLDKDRVQDGRCGCHENLLQDTCEGLSGDHRVCLPQSSLRQNPPRASDAPTETWTTHGDKEFCVTLVCLKTIPVKDLTY